jgi:hypothetical protein
MGWELVVSAAVGGLAGSILTALINAWVTSGVEKARIKEGRTRMAMELAKMKDSQLLEAVKISGQSGTPWDPAVALSDYLEALDEIDRTGRWAKGDSQFDSLRKTPRKAGG